MITKQVTVYRPKKGSSESEERRENDFMMWKTTDADWVTDEFDWLVENKIVNCWNELHV